MGKILSTLILFIFIQQYSLTANAQTYSHNEYKANLIIQIDKALILIENDYFNTGFTGNLLKGIEGTSAYNLNVLLKSISINIGLYRFRNLQIIQPTIYKDISELELKLLRKTLGSVDIGLSKKYLKRNIIEIKKYILKKQ